MSFRYSHFRTTLGLGLVIGLVAVAFLDFTVAWFVIPSVIGGIATGALLLPH